MCHLCAVYMKLIDARKTFQTHTNETVKIFKLKKTEKIIAYNKCQHRLT